MQPTCHDPYEADPVSVNQGCVALHYVLSARHPRIKNTSTMFYFNNASAKQCQIYFFPIDNFPEKMLGKLIV